MNIITKIAAPTSIITRPMNIIMSTNIIIMSIP